QDAQLYLDVFQKYSQCCGGDSQQKCSAAFKGTMPIAEVGHVDSNGNCKQMMLVMSSKRTLPSVQGTLVDTVCLIYHRLPLFLAFVQKEPPILNHGEAPNRTMGEAHTSKRPRRARIKGCSSIAGAGRLLCSIGTVIYLLCLTNVLPHGACRILIYLYRFRRSSTREALDLIGSSVSNSWERTARNPHVIPTMGEAGAPGQKVTVLLQVQETYKEKLLMKHVPDKSCELVGDLDLWHECSGALVGRKLDQQEEEHVRREAALKKEFEDQREEDRLNGKRSLRNSNILCLEDHHIPLPLNDGSIF
ncbi:hypothetical protein Tco_0214648, partial [Tanacetum coccineum]